MCGFYLLPLALIAASSLLLHRYIKKGGQHADVIVGAFMLTIGAVALCFPQYCVYKGVFWVVGGEPIRRDKNPWRFWFEVWIMRAIGAIVFLAGLAIMLGLFAPPR